MNLFWTTVRFCSGDESIVPVTILAVQIQAIEEAVTALSPLRT